MTERRNLPRIEGAVGLTWRPRKHGRWECRWLARTDIIERGWKPVSIKMWMGTEDELTPTIRQYLSDRSNNYQDEMLAWSRGFMPEAAVPTGEVKTWGELCAAYRNDPDSTFKKLRYKTRESYGIMMKKVEAAIGNDIIAETKARRFLRLHEMWREGGRVTSAAYGVTMLRILSNFGATILDDAACKEAAYFLSKMRFPASPPRGVFLTAENIVDTRRAAHEREMPSLALAQAIQFECILRQKDVIGEWVPVAEPGMSDVLDGGEKWLRGIRWEEVDQNLVLRHVTSKRGKLVTVPWMSAPMIVEELRLSFPGCITEEERIDPLSKKPVVVLVLHREKLPASGPVVVDEKFGVPYVTWRFRQQWRKCATIAGVPKEIRNMDSRAGAITEASEAGAPMEHIKQAATHSQMQQTENYSRNPVGKTANVLNIRAESRKNKT